MHRLMGRSLKSCIEIVETELGRALPATFVERLQADTYDAFRREGVMAVPGVASAIDALEAAGHRTCVASSGDLDKMQITLGGAGLWHRFEGRIFSASQVRRGKPFPDLFLHAAERMGADPADAVVVEDSPYGVEAAKAAGMTVVGYAGLTPATRLAGAIPVRVRWSYSNSGKSSSSQETGISTRSVCCPNSNARSACGTSPSRHQYNRKSSAIRLLS